MPITLESMHHCTCGHLLKESAANWGAIQCALDLSIQNHVIKKGQPHGHRHGKTPQKKEYHQAHLLKKRCIKKHFKGIHDRFLKDPEFRESQLEHDRTEEVCIRMDKDAQKDFTYHNTQAEHFPHGKNWWISLQKYGNNGPLKNRSDFNEVKPSTPRIWRTTTQAYAILEVPATAPIIEFFLQLVAMERFLVEFTIIQRKSINEDACKATW